MRDYGAILRRAAEAAKQHGPSGPIGPKAKTSTDMNRLDATVSGTTPDWAVVSVVPGPTGRDQRDQSPPSPGPTEQWDKDIVNQVVAETGTTGTTETIGWSARPESARLKLRRTGSDGWSGEDWWAFFDERAGIIEFDGGLPRADAEARAFDCCVAEWLNRNPARSPPGRCLGCGGIEHPDDKLLPIGTEQTGHAWLHSACWPSRKAEAVAALSAFGIRCE